MDLHALQEELDETTKNTSQSFSKGSFRHSLEERVREKYEIVEREIGKGAYGTVHKAVTKTTGEVVAIKHIDKRKAGAKGLSEVFSEVETMTLLNHSQIVHLEEVFQDDTSLWIVMEYLPGGSLHAALKEQKTLPEQEVRRVAVNLLLALEYIHGRGIVHRDLKLANCLLTETKEVKIADFGFAVMVGNDRCLTSFCGTTPYMAPEIVSRDSNYGKAVDMWSVGVMLFLMLSGEHPFVPPSSPKGKKSEADVAAVMERNIITGKYSFSNPIWHNISPGAKDLISKLLVVDPLQRLTARESLNHPYIKQLMREEYERFETWSDGDNDSPVLEIESPDDLPRVKECLSGDLTGSDLSKRGKEISNSSFTSQRSVKRKLTGSSTVLHRRRGAKALFVAAVRVVMACHRLVFLNRLRQLREDNCAIPLVCDFPYVISKHYEPVDFRICAGTACQGNMKAILLLADMLEASKTVEHFDVSNNEIDNLEVVQHIVKACQNHPSLTSLNLESNPIPPVAGRALLRLSRMSQKLKTININNTPIPADTVMQIAANLRELEIRRLNGEVGSPVGSPKKTVVSIKAPIRAIAPVNRSVAHLTLAQHTAQLLRQQQVHQQGTVKAPVPAPQPNRTNSNAPPVEVEGFDNDSSDDEFLNGELSPNKSLRPLEARRRKSQPTVLGQASVVGVRVGLKTKTASSGELRRLLSPTTSSELPVGKTSSTLPPLGPSSPPMVSRPMHLKDTVAPTRI